LLAPYNQKKRIKPLRPPLESIFFSRGIFNGGKGFLHLDHHRGVFLGMNTTDGTPALPLDDVDAIIAYHNIAGADGVLNAAASQLEQQARQHYAARGIDHIPFLEGRNIQCYVLTSDPYGLAQQAAYREKLVGTPFNPICHLDELQDAGVRRALFLPYIRLKDEPLPPAIEWMRYGLPPHLTQTLKDKGLMHQWLVNNGFAKHVPNHIVCHAPDIPQAGGHMLKTIAEMLVTFGLREHYPLGLMIRSALSDGNYAMAAVIQATHDLTWRRRYIKRGQFMLKPNGKADQLEIFDRAEDALARVRDHIQHENNMSVDDRVVITRFLDIDISPGLSAAVVRGQAHMMAFNGQYMAPGDTACTGTTTFATAVGPERSHSVTQAYLAQSQALLGGILERFFIQEDVNALYAMLNMDVMVVGGLEAELYERALAHPQGGRYLSAVGACDEAYAPRIYPPDTVLFAEINPRDTNWSLAMKATLQLLGLPCTVENLQAVSYGHEVQVLTRDHWRLPEGLDLQTARDLLLDYHHDLQAQDEGFVLRMSDNPAGIIAYTHSDDPYRLEELVKDAYDYLESRMEAVACK
jgi:hypothetical protein